MWCTFGTNFLLIQFSSFPWLIFFNTNGHFYMHRQMWFFFVFYFIRSHSYIPLQGTPHQYQMWLSSQSCYNNNYNKNGQNGKTILLRFSVQWIKIDEKHFQNDFNPFSRMIMVVLIWMYMLHLYQWQCHTTTEMYGCIHIHINIYENTFNNGTILHRVYRWNIKRHCNSVHVNNVYICIYNMFRYCLKRAAKFNFKNIMHRSTNSILHTITIICFCYIYFGVIQPNNPPIHKFSSTVLFQIQLAIRARSS